MVPEYEGQHKPKTQMWAGGVICLGSIILAIVGPASIGLTMAALGAWLFNQGRVRTKAAKVEHADTPSLSPDSNIAKRPILLFASINIGVIAMMVWQYSQVVRLPLWIFVVAGLSSLVFFNGVALFMYKKATAPQRDKNSK